MFIQLQPSCGLTLGNTCAYRLQDKLAIRKRSQSHLQHTTSVPEPELKKRSARAVKTVTFSTNNEIIPVRSMSSSKDWDSKADALRFHADTRRDIQYLATLIKERRLEDFQQTEYCSVGIEKHCCNKDTRYKRQALKNLQFHSVLELQRAQRKMGVSDTEAIRRVAEQYSKESSARACTLATGLWTRP
jgi:hypothetical protein